MHDANPPTQHANGAGRHGIRPKPARPQQLPASQRHTGPRQPLLQTFQVVQIIHPDAHNHVHARTLEPFAAFAFVVDHATQRAAVHHLRIHVFHEPIELDHNNPTIARAPQKIDAVPFLPVCGSVNSTCWAGARTRTGSSRRAPSPHRRFPRMAWRSGTRSGRWRSSVLRAWRMR